MQSKMHHLCRALGYEFKTPALLQQALTHCSAGIKNNERFEFLGDSILSVVIAHALFEKFPQESEGQLSRLRAYLVKGEMLACIAQDIKLGDYLVLGPGELRSGGHRRASILADALEAIFAAVFIDRGFSASRQVILHLYQTRLQDKQLNDNLKDAKTQLQEYLQAKKHPLPTYELTHVTGHEHDQRFYVLCSVTQLKISSEGVGSNRRQAEQQAAMSVLEQLKKPR